MGTTFVSWLLQQQGRNDPVGDPARSALWRGKPYYAGYNVPSL